MLKTGRVDTIVSTVTSMSVCMCHACDGMLWFYESILERYFNKHLIYNMIS
jgi:hypothetical protein